MMYLALFIRVKTHLLPAGLIGRHYPCCDLTCYPPAPLVLEFGVPVIETKAMDLILLDLNSSILITAGLV